MKTLLLFLLSFSIANAQLVFKNSNSNSNSISKFIVNQNTTELFVNVDNKEILVARWNETPISSNSAVGQSQYKMNVYKEDKSAKITYEIKYSLFRKTNKYVGYIKTTYVYPDKKPTKTTEDYFTI